MIGCWRSLVSAMTLVAAETVYADLMPISPRDSGRQRVSVVGSRADSEGSRSWDPFTSGLDSIDLRSQAVFSVDQTVGSGEGRSIPAERLDLTETSGSLGFCLYALLGLGLCQSGHWLRNCSLDVVPEWYHSGGPFQIGYSLAISPDTLCSTPVCCFVQPEAGGQGPLAPSRPIAIVSPWPRSQFTPVVLAARGPPSREC